MLWDPIRCLWVKATPEEKVRQQCIQKMIGALGFPKSLLAVEKDLSTLPGQTSKDRIPNRRLDLLCFTPRKEGLLPLLLIECKAGSILDAAERQVLGYNDSVGAFFVCLVNEQEAKTVWHEKGEIASIPFLPSYAQLVEKL